MSGAKAQETEGREGGWRKGDRRVVCVKGAGVGAE